MSKRNDLKAAWRAIRASQAKQQMSKVNHLVWVTKSKSSQRENYLNIITNLSEVS